MSHVALLVLKLHSHIGGATSLLHVSALSKHVAESRHEHPGWPGVSVRFMQSRPAAHTSNVGELKLHVQFAGLVEVSHVSALSKQCDELEQEQAGCPGFSVIFTQSLPVSHGSIVGRL